MKENQKSNQPYTQQESPQHTNEDSPITNSSMEVHHHPDLDHKKKNFKEYFLEFLMIFLAVTLGFFAESIREHVSDNSKEHEYLSALKKDLATDTVNLSTWMQAFNSRIKGYDTLINMLREPQNIADGAKLYYLSRITTRGTVFEDNNNTMIQLNVSGNFRLIRNKIAAEKIVAYQTDIDDYKRINEYDSYEARSLYAPQSKLFNAFVFNDMSKPIVDSTISGANALLGGFLTVLTKPSGNPKLLTTDKEKINDFVYYLHQRRSTFAAEILILYKQKQDAKALIELLDKQFQ
jgi:hypothetical protein